MRINKFALVLGVVLTAILFAEVAAHADEGDQSEKITFSQPIQIPGQVLPTGTYLFQTRGSEYHTAVTLAEPGNGMPDVLLNWFYPGNTDGHAFEYSKHEEQQLAEYPRQTIVANDTTESGD